MNIPQAPIGLFSPDPYRPPQNADENNLNTIAALQDPKGTLERMRSDQILKGIAGLKLDGIDNKHQELALKAIQDYKDLSKSLYQERKGFNRLTLSAEQQLKEDQEYKKLLTDINSLKEAKEIYNKTLSQVHEMFAKRTITPAQYHEVSKILEQSYEKAKTIKDVPNTWNVLNNWLQTQPMTTKVGSGMYKSPEEWMDIRNKPQMGKTAAEYDPKILEDQLLLEMNSGEWQNNTRPMLLETGILKQGMTPSQELDAAKAYGKLRFNEYENRRVGNTTNVNLPNWQKNWQPKYRIIDGELRFNAKPTNGVIIVNSVDSKNGGKRLNPGDLFVPKETFTENGMRYVSGVTAKKGQDFSSGPEGITVKSGVILTPITVPVSGVKDIIESNYFKPDQQGYPDMSTWDKLNKAENGGYFNHDTPAETKATIIVNGKKETKDVVYTLNINGEEKEVTKQEIYDKLKKINPGITITEKLIQQALANYGYDGTKNPKLK